MRVWIAALALVAGAAGAQSPVLFDAEGYRVASARAPVDRDPAPARRIALAEARGLHPGADSLFIDVLPAGLPRDPATGAWRLAEPHQTIPGAVWLPETGRAPVDAKLWAGLRARVAAFRMEHPQAPVVLFCRADCWMSWNAARRLAAAGVSDVRWLSEGIEGWHEAGGALVDAQPGGPD